MNGFFRQEVIDAKRESWLGPVRIAAPLSIWPLAALGAVAMIAIFALILFGRHVRTVKGDGQITPETGLLVIKSPASNSGIVEQRWAKDGDHVVAGQDLIEISTDVASSEFGLTAAAETNLLRTRRSQLESERLAIQRSCEEQALQISDRIANLQTQSRLMQNELGVRQKQLHLDEGLLERIRPLIDRGYVSRAQGIDQAGQVARSQSDIAELRLRQAQLEQAAKDAATDLAQQPDKCRQLLGENSQKSSDVERQLLEGAPRQHLIVRAPRSGTVSNSTYQVGQTVGQAEHLLDIWPDGEPLAAELWIPSGGVGSIRPGQRVALHFKAYPDSRYGKQRGVVKEVARSALSANDYQRQTGLQATTPMYRVIVAISGRVAGAPSPSLALLPGDVIEGDIEVGVEALFPLFHQDAGGASKASIPPHAQHQRSRS